jgi:diaminopimelate decarboxylase
VLKLGGDANKIIYSNPVKNEKDLKWAYKVGVPFTTADTMDELIKIKKYAPGMKVLWRITIKEDNPNLLKTAFSGKFGDDIGSAEEAEQRFKEIR